MAILVTGGAGFIGSHLVDRLLRAGRDVAVLDNLDGLYDPAIKRRNLDELRRTAASVGRALTVHDVDLRDADGVHAAVGTATDAVVHLGALAGVRPSIADPRAYAQVNVIGTVNVLAAMQAAGVRSLAFASSSSVYGNRANAPFREDDRVDTPISPYAATKKAGELLCHTWHHLHGLSVACLRFFTVYGPRQRPDLAIAKFIDLVDAGRPIPVFGDGSMSRDYTFAGDIADGIERALAWTQAGDAARYGVFNLGNSSPVTLTELIAAVGTATGQEVLIDRQPTQPGDVDKTFADVSKAAHELGWAPQTPFVEGLRQQVAWARARRAQ